MIGTVGLKSLRVDCIMGVYDFEHEAKQPLLIDIELDYDFSKAAETDQVEHAVDYDKVAEVLDRVVQRKLYRLLEAYAEDSVNELFTELPHVSRIAMEVRKPQAVTAAAASFVIVDRSRPH